MGSDCGEEIMAKMAELDAALTELPDEAKDFMQGFYRGRAEGIEQERERIIKFLEELKEYWSEQVEFEYGIVSAINADQAIAFIKGEN